MWTDAQIDGVIICSETDRHEPLVLAAAAAKKHIFAEKPLGLGATDAYRMAAAIKKAGILFQTGYFQRGNPIHLFLREQISAGNFGQISRIRHTNCHAGSLKGWFDTEWRWMADPAQAGVGGFGDLGTHSLDILLWLMGGVKDVTASIKAVTGRYGDCDETGEALLNFTSGAIGSLGWAGSMWRIPSARSSAARRAMPTSPTASSSSRASADRRRWQGAVEKLPEAWPRTRSSCIWTR